MKTTITILLICLFANFATAQTEQELIKEIRKHYKWVNSQKDFVPVVLNNQDFLDQATDNGATMTGYYKNNKLYKIIETVGISYAVITSEYYFWSGELFFIYHTEKAYKEKKDDAGNFIELDYTKTELKYEDRQYFNKDKQIRRIKKGEILSTENNFLKRSKNLKPLLDNKKIYKAQYKMLQGKWFGKDNKKDVMQIEGLVQTVFFDDEYIYASRIKIDDKHFSIKSFEDNSVTVYQLIELSKDVFKYFYEESSTTFEYYK